MPRGRSKKEDSDDLLLKSADLLGWAIGGLEREIAQTKERLMALSEKAARLRARVGSAVTERSQPAAASQESQEPRAAKARGTKRRKKMSLEARRRMSEMMKKKWAERKGTE